MYVIFNCLILKQKYVPSLFWLYIAHIFNLCIKINLLFTALFLNFFHLGIHYLINNKCFATYLFKTVQFHIKQIDNSEVILITEKRDY